MRKNFSSLLSTRYEPMNMISMINKPLKLNKKRRSPSLNLYIIDLYDLLSCSFTEKESITFIARNTSATDE